MRIPSSEAVRKTRIAISPRFATSSRRIGLMRVSQPSGEVGAWARGTTEGRAGSRAAGRSFRTRPLCGAWRSSEVPFGSETLHRRLDPSRRRETERAPSCSRRPALNNQRSADDPGASRRGAIGAPTSRSSFLDRCTSPLRLVILPRIHDAIESTPLAEPLTAASEFSRWKS
ncbi:MAG TPA: hypothetical protein DCQ98_07090 [Planctomycetaceae bacterium]|nr:hypothetical protein [Planctomycetaceae bacterium]